jgi:hypothetical protein
MTIADNARNLAISLEAKKDALSQKQSGDWRVTFTVQEIDMDRRFTSAKMGTRYAMVLVEIGDDETPVQRPAKENKTSVAPAPEQDPKSARGKRDWRDLQPAAQAGIRCAEPTFRVFLCEMHGYDASDETLAAQAVRHLCGVNSRVELAANHKARVLWHQLDEQFQGWLAMERA